MSSASWTVTEITGEKQYGGNEGYYDRPGEEYAYDSNVANHRNLKQGDLIILRDAERATGLAVISEVREADGLKELKKCPRCRKTKIKARKTLKPEWRCSNKECRYEFDEPLSKTVAVKEFRALYGNSYLPLQNGPSRAALRTAILRPSNQLSIEEIDPFRIDWTPYPEAEAVIGLLDQLSHRNYSVEGGFIEEAEDSSKGSDEDDHTPSSKDRRTRVLREIAARRGQQKFRKGLIRKFHSRCAVSGCSVSEALEAAHIAPYRSDEDNSLTNSILLRSDLHTLFDLDLIGIHPVEQLIAIHPSLWGSEYQAFDKTPLQEHEGRLSKKALQLRWEQFQIRLREAAKPQCS
jgi:putative restriction endonuclease